MNRLALGILISAAQLLTGVGIARAESGKPASISVVRAVGQETITGTADKFTGTVKVTSLFNAAEPARIRGGVVAFDAGARTAWHTHPLGQTLFISSGCGWVQSEGNPVQEVRPGDIVQIPANTRHWHGASAEKSMRHLAVLEPLDGKSTTWMELVSEQDYAEGANARKTCAK